MTTRNLNKTWRDVVFAQYAADLEADVPFPLRYLINACEWKKDIFIEIPNKISVNTFRRSILNFFNAKRVEPEPDYQNENISVRARVSPFKKQDQKANNQHDHLESQDFPDRPHDVQNSRQSMDSFLIASH